MINGRFERRSIPPWTALDVLRGQARGGLNFDRSFQNRPVQNQDGFNLADHVYKKPSKPLIVPGAEKIRWETEWHEYGTEGSLLVILQFFGIEFTNVPVFKKSRTDYGTNGFTFCSPIYHKGKEALLTLVTLDDIIEFQVVEKGKDNPISRDETRLPQLTTTHDPTSMSVHERNHLVIVGYNRL